MLHFFRKIRHDLIANSKSYKYLKYGIGEIVLVVLGILIALQINNWNEERKEQEKFDNVLVEVEKELIANIENVNNIVQYLYPYDSIASIVLFEGLTREDLEKDSGLLFRLFPDEVSFEFEDRAFNKLMEIENGITTKQDSLKQHLITLFKKDRMHQLQKLDQRCTDLITKIIESTKKYDWYTNSRLRIFYDDNEIDYYLNDPAYKKNVVTYAELRLSRFINLTTQYENDFLDIYDRVYEYLEEQNIQHVDSLLFGYDPDQFKHYLGKFKEVNDDEFVEIELINNKYVISIIIKEKKINLGEIIPATKYYGRMRSFGAYFTFIFNDKDEVSEVIFSRGIFRSRYIKIEN